MEKIIRIEALTVIIKFSKGSPKIIIFWVYFLHVIALNRLRTVTLDPSLYPPRVQDH